MNILNNNEIPMGLGMALAQNSRAMEVFSNLPSDKQQQIIQGTHGINSKTEMKLYVDNILKMQ